ncbi:hypothetical protein NKG05_09370 [Oerskovia sp. M15]
MIGAALAVLTALGLFAAVASSSGAQLMIGAGDVLGCGGAAWWSSSCSRGWAWGSAP